MAGKVSDNTLRRYASSLAVLRPLLDGLYLDEVDKKLIGSIVDSRRDTPYVPKGKKQPIKVTIATIKRDLTASLETKALFWHRREVGKRSRLGQQPARRYSEMNFDRLVDDVAEKAQKQDQDFRPFRFHDLRHLHAVNWLKSGRSIYALQQRLGHTSIKTTEMYLAYLTADEKHKVMFGRAQSGSKSGSRAAV